MKKEEVRKQVGDSLAYTFKQKELTCLWDIKRSNHYKSKWVYVKDNEKKYVIAEIQDVTNPQDQINVHPLKDSS
jgi:hypothetical protein